MKIVKGLDMFGRGYDVYYDVKVSDALQVFRGLETIEEMEKAIELMKEYKEEYKLELEFNQASKSFGYDEDHGYYLKSAREDIFGY